MKAIIVEDEINVREGFIKLLNAFCPEIILIGVADSVDSGIKLINNSSFDLLFLDINLPDGSGFDLMYSLTNKDFSLIFVTAYNQYAIDAFKLSAVDYLLKPVSPEALKNAIVKIKTIKSKVSQKDQLNILDNNLNKQSNQGNKIILKDHNSIYLIQVKDILYCCADGGYTVFYLVNNEKIMISSNLKEYERLLTPYNFLRSHRSYLVNLNHIIELKKSDGGILLMSNNDQIPISFRKRTSILEAMKKLFIN